MSEHLDTVELKDICKEIGCAGLSAACPGDEYCSILRRILNYKLDKE